MNSIKYLYIFFGTLVALSLNSCSESFLDHVPDERTEIDSEQKVIDLLKTAYPVANTMWVGEISSDNLIDNQAPHLPTKPWDKQILTHYNYGTYDRWDEELFRFQPVTLGTYSDSDSPGRIWGGYYASIAACNAALQALDEIKAKNGGQETDRMRAARAEALLIRAYSHFCLSNVFCQAYKDPERSRLDIGIPYVTEIEDVVSKNYDRGNVAEVYEKIEADLLAGLAGVDELYYTQPKWHFNVNAAHAFAARFYLYKREWAKVVEHANYVLGTDNNTLLNMMMDYSVFTDCATGSDYSLAWQSPTQNNNLMLIGTYSLMYRRCFGYRYSCAGPPARDVFLINSRHAFWNSYYVCPIALVSGMCFGNSTHDYGFITSKIFEQFEYSDKIAGIGYPHIIVRAFTANELLLERAEAKIMLGQLDAGAEDLCAYWNNSIDRFSEADYKSYLEAGYIKYITKDMIVNWYSVSSHGNCHENWDFTQTNISPSYVISAEQVPYMNCVNEFRRFETMFEGLRFFDLKRWGVEYSHVCGVYSEEIPLTGNDSHRAIEVPWETISAGMESSYQTGKDNQTNQLIFNPEDFRIK
ncbi:MAG: RagB/SusD family nutrient uptake outer membrane protein [Prevotella sp.]|nr:RagB/SusD family nutrient uptake outer membrane protein [Prevotella sp.]